MESSAESSFGTQWAIVEVFGRHQFAGRVSEQVIAGSGFLRVDVPAINGNPAYTRFFGTAAIYGITPVDEAVVLVLLQSQANPILALGLPQPRREVDLDDFEEIDDDFNPF
jgi:hypothetical protein